MEFDDICEQCGEVSDCLNDNLVCPDCLIEAVDFYDKYDY